MAIELNFNEYDGMYKRIVSIIEIERPIEYEDKIYYEMGTSLEEPLAYDDTSFFGQNGLFINDEYFIKNKSQMLELVIDTIKSTFKETFTLTGDELITDEVIDALCSNKYIKEVNLNSLVGISKKQLETLMNRNFKDVNCSVDFENYPELLYEYYPNITYNNYPSICGNTIADFAIGEVDFLIDEELTPEELEQLKQLFNKYPQTEIGINFRYKEQMKEILQVINADQVIIDNSENLTIDDYKYFDELDKNIAIGLTEMFEETIYVTPSRMIETDNTLNMIVDEVKSLNLSPLEQYMYLYNITKMFKEYKDVEPKENYRLSKDLQAILFNDYIVCVGYVELLKSLVEKLDNDNLSVTDYSCMIDDNCEIEGHRKCLVKIKDEEYGIDGIYISDPTWDCVQYYKKVKNEDGEVEYDYSSPIADHDYYNHFLLTKEETIDDKIEYVFGDVTDVIFGTSDNNGKEISSDIYTDAYNKIKQLYKNDQMNRDMVDNEIANLKQVPVGFNTIVGAIRKVYSKIYYGTEDEIEKLVSNTVEINNEVQQKEFNLTKDKFNNKSNRME